MIARSEPILRVEDLSVSYGALRALSDMSWSIQDGEVLGIIGPNGAGKSTCYNAATNMTRRQGRVFLHGRDITALPPWELAPLGLRRTFQQNVFFGQLSVIENMASALATASRHLSRCLSWPPGSSGAGGGRPLRWHAIC